MEKGKYIIVELVAVGEFPILFPSFVDHSTVAGTRTVVSAGTFEVVGKKAKQDGGDISVWAGGESVTLKVKSREQDAGIIKKILKSKFTY